MGLKNHIIKQDDIRLQYKDLIVTQLTHKKKELIKQYIITNYTKNSNGEDVIESSFSDIGVFRLMIKELTNFGKEVRSLTDDELEDIILNGDDVIKTMESEFIKMFQEINEEQKAIFLSMINNVIAVGESIEVNQKAEESIELISSKLGLTKEQVISMVSDSEKLKDLQKLLEEETKNKKITPQDHLPKQEKKKRGRKKKVVKTVEESKIEEIINTEIVEVQSITDEEVIE